MKILVLIFVFFIYQYSHSQNVFVELSIEWQLDSVYFKGFIQNKKTPIPYLIIRYNNLSEDNIFLKRLIAADEIYLPNTRSSLMNTNLQYDELAMKTGDYSDDNYVFSIDKFCAEYDTVNKKKEHELPIINDDLFNIYNALLIQHHLNESKTNIQLACFNYENKKYVTYNEGKNIIHSKEFKLNSNSFILLDKGQFIQQKISLFAFILIKGTFLFKIQESSIIPESDSKKINGKTYIAPKRKNILINNIGISF